MDGFGDGDFPRISLSAASRLAIISDRNPNFILPWFLVDMGYRLGHGGVSRVALRILPTLSVSVTVDLRCRIRKLIASCMAWRLRDLSALSIRSSRGTALENLRSGSWFCYGPLGDA
jgi:hypothetical protein